MLATLKAKNPHGGSRVHKALGSYYGTEAIGRSLRHFLVGKGFKVLSSMALVVLLARYLSREEYAVYISLQALILVGGTLTSGGIQAVLLRYLPELRAAGNNLAAYRLLRHGILLRTATACVLMLALMPFLPLLAGILHLGEWWWLLPWYLAVGVLHLTTLTLSQSLESLLWQREAQYSLAAGSLIRLLGVMTALGVGELDLASVVVVEACTEGLTLVLLVCGGYLRWRADDRRGEGDLSWWHHNRRRLFRYGLWSFFMSQTKVLYGSASNRLLTFHYVAPAELAVLGFADSLTGLARRFMPTRLLIGFIRPVFMARFSATGDFDQLVGMVNLAYRLNIMIFALPIALAWVVGQPLFAWLTAGKYEAAALLFAGFLVLMITEGMRNLVELLTQAVEKNQTFLLGNLVQSASLFLAIPLFPALGLWAPIVANITGTVIANVIGIQWLRRCGYGFRLDVGPVLLIVFYGTVAGAVGGWLQEQVASPVLSGLVMVAAYGLLCTLNPPFSREERALIKRVVGRKPRTAPVSVVAHEA
jgi:O-antigen/teichoic acid export membrane protein